VQWDPYNVPVLSEVAGTVKFHDLIEGITVKRELDEATGLMGTVVIEHKEDLHPQVNLVNAGGEVIAFYAIPAGAHIVVEEGSRDGAGRARCQDAAKGLQNERYHRRSAARRGIVRSTTAEGRSRKSRRSTGLSISRYRPRQSVVLS